ncbi:MAG: response regulator transcription factor [Chloroflexi bacterium]|nr:response regulator transcription factor [Chloroflexota bacterium]MDA1228198.1 response regulator transcription factor [Chloroflexota bacterium]
MIVDDQGGMRQMMRKILEADGGFDVVCEASNGKEALELVEEQPLDLILMDVQMPQMDGFEATKQILASHPNIGIAITSMNKDAQYVRLANEVGAMGFIAKQALKGHVLMELMASRAS